MTLTQLYIKALPYLWGYGAIRTGISMSQVPLKENELYTHRLGIYTLNTLYTPIIFPIYMYNDISNIERKIRKIKTELFIAGMQ
jgi:hypothetical protein